MSRNFLTRLRQLVLPAADALPPAPTWCVELRPPSEFPAPGIARWGTYPGVELSDSTGHIRLGLYQLSDSEAIKIARNLLSAVARKEGRYRGRL